MPGVEFVGFNRRSRSRLFLFCMKRETDMAFAISAYFPLGFYQGSDSGGRPEEFPSLCRLYSALVSVAYLTFGFEQVDANRNLTDDQIREALNWLEDNPPQGMLLPHAVKADSRAVAYRNKGNVQNIPFVSFAHS